VIRRFIHTETYKSVARKRIVETSGNRLRRLVEYILVPCNTEFRTKETGELGLHSKVTEEEMTRRLHNDLK
jgi:hypothetical protein